MELTQSRIQKIWLPNDNRPALPRRCEYGHRSIPEGWDWDGGMGWVESTPLSLRTPAGLFAAPSQHPCSIPPPFSRCPSILPVPASHPLPSRDSLPALGSGRKVQPSHGPAERRMRGGAGTRVAQFPLSAPSLGIKRRGSRLFTSHPGASSAGIFTVSSSSLGDLLMTES